MIHIDFETAGLHGFPVLLQYAKDDGEIKMHEIWREPIGKTLDLFEWIAQDVVCAFNLGFDWFHLSKCYTTFLEIGDRDFIPEDDINRVALCEERARFLDVCIKPKSAIDLMLHARKGPYQSLMSRSEIRIKRIPAILSDDVRDELERRIHLDGIYFAKRADKNAPQWKIADSRNLDNENDPAFRDIVLTFNPSTALKVLAEHALGISPDTILKFADISVPSYYQVKDKSLGYAPYALAFGSPGNWNGMWPQYVKFHIEHWAFNSLARKYASDDIVYLRDLFKYFKCPEHGDDDSVLAAMQGSVRWRGFAIDKDNIQKQLLEAIKKRGETPTAPKPAKGYLKEVMDDDEWVCSEIDVEGTGVTVLEAIAGKEDIKKVWQYAWLTDDGQPHSAAVRAREILEARWADKDINQWKKMLVAGRFHAAFDIIGTKTSRMAGLKGSGFNAQGVRATTETRECFPLADFDFGFVLSGGDFDSFEVVLAAAEYDDPKLTEDIRAGKSIHGLFSEALFEISYDEIMATKKENDYYTDGKRGIFGKLYGGTVETLVNRLGITLEKAQAGSDRFDNRYKGVGVAREKIRDQFCSMRQPGGIGTAVEWHDPAEYVESRLGFRRYFTLENKICKTLFNIAENPPEKWKSVRIRVKRRDRLQLAGGACRSALFAAAFNIQAKNMRAAANHKIQSTGAQITKHVQRRVWDLQPCGANPWAVQTMNVHDEIHVVSKPETVEEIAKVVDDTVEPYREQIPLISIDWNRKETSWASK